MITLSKKRAEKLLQQGKIKPAKETVRKKQNIKSAKDISKAVAAIELTSKSIEAASTKISKSLIILASKGAKSANEKKEWNFTIIRDKKGLIKTIKATEV